MSRNAPSGWFFKTTLADGLTRYVEPHVDETMRSNIWHLKGRDADLLVDTGMGLGDLAGALDRPSGKPLIVVATHAHVDHVGSLHQFATRFGPRLEAEAFATMADRVTYADWFRALAEPVALPPFPGWSAAAYRLTPAPLTRLLDDGDTVDLGDRVFHVLHLPGHSPGSLGLYDEADGLLFSGDAVYDDALYDMLPDSDRVAYRATMARLAALPVRIVHGGHAESFGEARLKEIAFSYIAAGESRPKA